MKNGLSSPEKKMGGATGFESGLPFRANSQKLTNRLSLLAGMHVAEFGLTNPNEGLRKSNVSKCQQRCLCHLRVTNVLHFAKPGESRNHGMVR